MKSKKCLKCGRCCQSPHNQEYSVLILPSDVIEISKYLNITKSDFVNIFCKKSILRVDDLEIVLFMLKFIRDRCVFLTKDSLCSIYRYRPRQCKEAPYNFLSSVDLWKMMPCVDINYLKKCISKEEDEKNIEELLRGYEL